MAEITAKMVKELREATGAGMMECKKALTEAEGDFEKAVDVLRTHGLAKAAKKAGRATNEGRVNVAVCKNDARQGCRRRGQLRDRLRRTYRQVPGLLRHLHACRRP